MKSAMSAVGLRRYAELYLALWQNSVAREMGFKSNFLLWIVVELLWFALHVSFIAVIYQHTDRIGDWSKWQVVLLIGAAHFIQQIFQALFLSNCVQISEHVRTGKLDFMLLLPVNTRFLVSFRVVDLGGFINAGSAVVLMLYALHELHHAPTVAQMAGFLGLVGVGVLVHYSLMFALASISFWTVRAQGIVWGYYSLFNIARLPDAAFKGFFKSFFTFALPMLLVANVPAKMLLNKLTSPFDIFLLLVLASMCALFSEAIWRFSLKHYTSASS
jgi:ABC-2 type transport system permease protein